MTKLMNLNTCMFEIKRELDSKNRLTIMQLEHILAVAQEEDELPKTALKVFLKCCGSVATTVSLRVKNRILDEIWKLSPKFIPRKDIDIYNTFLRVCLENERSISPQEFLIELQECQLTPNQETYEYLLESCCREGRIEDAVVVLQEMEKKKLVLNPKVFSLLLLGYFIKNDMSAAEEMLHILEQKNFAASPRILTVLLALYAQNDEVDKFNMIIDKWKNRELYIHSWDALELYYYATVKNHLKARSELLDLLAQLEVKDDVARNWIFKLIGAKEYDAMFDVVARLYSGIYSHWIRFIIRFIALNSPSEEIITFSEKCRKRGYGLDPIAEILYYLFMNNLHDEGFDLVVKAKSTGHHLRRIYLLPLLIDATKLKNWQRLEEIIRFRNELKFYFSGKLICRTIFDNIDKSVDKKMMINRLISWGLDLDNVLQAYVSNSVRWYDLKSVADLCDDYIITECYLEELHHQFATALKMSSDLESFIKILNTWILQTKFRSYVRIWKIAHPTHSISSMNEINKRYIDDHIEGRFKALVSVFSRTDNDLLMELLKALKNNGIRINTKVVSYLNFLSKKDSNFSMFMPSLLKVQYDDTRIYREVKRDIREQIIVREDPCLTVDDKVLEYFVKNDVEAAERYIRTMAFYQENDDEIIQKYKLNVKKMKREKKFGRMRNNNQNDHKKYVEIINNWNDSFGTHFHFFRWIRKGFLKKAFALTDPEKLSESLYDQLIVSLAKGIDQDVVDIKAIMDASSDTQFLTRLMNDLAQHYSSRGQEDKVIDFIKSSQIFKLNLNFTKLFRPLYASSKISSLKRVVDEVETNCDHNQVWMDLIFGFSCTGEIERGQYYTDRLLKAKNKENELKVFTQLLVAPENLNIIKNAIRITNFGETELIRTAVRLFNALETPKEDIREFFMEAEKNDISLPKIALDLINETLENKPVVKVDSKLEHELLTTNLPEGMGGKLLGFINDSNATAVIDEILFNVRAGNLNLSTVHELLKKMKAADESVFLKEVILVFEKFLSGIEIENAFIRGELFDYLKGLDERCRADPKDFREIPSWVSNNLLHRILEEKEVVNFKEGSSISARTLSLIGIWAHLYLNAGTETLARAYYEYIKVYFYSTQYVEDLLEGIIINKSKTIIKAILKSKVLSSHPMAQKRLQKALWKLEESSLNRNYSFEEDAYSVNPYSCTEIIMD